MNEENEDKYISLEIDDKSTIIKLKANSIYTIVEVN
jgi:hypothetical protein